MKGRKIYFHLERYAERGLLGLFLKRRLTGLANNFLISSFFKREKVKVSPILTGYSSTQFTYLGR